MARSLQQGRGYRQGENAYVNQQESFATRAQALPLADQFILSPQVFDLSPATVLFSGQIFVPMGFYEKSIRIAEARAYETIGSGPDFTTQLYVLTSENTLRSQPGTQAIFDMSTIGLKVAELDTILPAGQRFFIGMQKAAGGTLAGYGNLITQTLNRYYTTAITTGLPGTVDLNSVPKASVQTIPLVKYYSRNAAQVL